MPDHSPSDDPKLILCIQLDDSDPIGRLYQRAYGDCAQPMLEMDLVDALAKKLKAYGELTSPGALVSANQCIGIWEAGTEVALRITARRNRIVVESVGRTKPQVELAELCLGEHERTLTGEGTGPNQSDNGAAES